MALTDCGLNEAQATHELQSFCLSSPSAGVTRVPTPHWHVCILKNLHLKLISRIIGSTGLQGNGNGGQRNWVLFFSEETHGHFIFSFLVILSAPPTVCVCVCVFRVYFFLILS